MDDAQAKLQTFLGDDKDSRIEVLSDRAEATFRVLFKDENREPLDILMEEFIDDKSARAKGKRVTTLEVASIEDITPAPVEPEPLPEEEPSDESPVEESSSRDLEVSNEIDIDGVPMTIEPPKDTQLDLF